MNKTHFSQRIISLVLSCIIFTVSLFSPLQVNADTIFSASLDAVQLVDNLFGLAGNIINGTYDFTMKVVDDIVSGITPDMGASYDATNKTFNFPVDNSNNVVINQKFYNYAYNIAQNHVHALDGYYLIEQNYNFTTLENYIWENSQYFDAHPNENFQEFFDLWLKNGRTFNHMFLRNCSDLVRPSIVGFDSDLFYLNNENYLMFYPSSDSTNYLRYAQFVFQEYGTWKYEFQVNVPSPTLESFKKYYFYVGSPIKVFYTLKDATRYYNQGRIYVPKINVSSNGIVIKQEYITNNTIQHVINNVITNNNYDYSSNDEINIQNSIDADVNNALSDLFNDGVEPTPTSIPQTTPGGTTSPTPTPSGSFGDDVTPTPIPVTPIPGDTGETTSLLQQILDTLTSFKDSWKEHSDNLFTTLAESNTKLDDIITALEKIVTGDIVDKSKECKYDYTVLSDFLTTLWNESDKKFDTMIELLEENNEYQQKLLDSLNQIKALLVAETVMDFFKDRSNETANKAKEKFPTSIPWDIAMVVNAMCATPEEPVIKCPIVIQSIGVNEEFVIDLSTEEWAKLAKTCRSLLSILFVLYLVHLTRKLFYKGGED